MKDFFTKNIQYHSSTVTLQLKKGATGIDNSTFSASGNAASTCSTICGHALSMTSNTAGSRS